MKPSSKGRPISLSAADVPQRRSSSSSGKPTGAMPAEILDRMPPSNIEAEKNLIGCLLLDPDCLDRVGYFDRSYFYSDACGRLFEHASNAPPEVVKDTTLFGQWLMGANDLEACGGVAFMAECMQSVPYSAHAKHYADLIRDMAAKRRVLHWATEVICMAHDPAAKPVDLEALTSSLQLDKIAAERFERMDMKQFANEKFKQDTVIKNILIAGQPGVIGGPEKSLKTSIGLDLAMSAATGTNFLNAEEFPCRRKAKVLFMSGEGGKRFIQSKLKQIAASKGLNLEDVEGLTICFSLPNLSSSSDLAALRSAIKSVEAEFVVIDPIYLCLHVEQSGNILVMGERLEAVKAACDDAGATPILIHHVNKSSDAAKFGGSAPMLIDLAQAGFSAYAGQWILIGREKPYDSEEPGVHRLIVSYGSREWDGGSKAVAVFEGVYPDRRWEVDVQSIAEKIERSEEDKEARQVGKRKATGEKRLKAVVNCLVSIHPKGMSQTVIGAETGLSNANVKAAIVLGIERRFIEEITVPVGNRNIAGYRAIIDSSTL